MSRHYIGKSGVIVEVEVHSITACDLDMFIHVPSQQMSRTYSEGEKSSAYFEEVVSAKKSCICSFLFCHVFRVFVWCVFTATDLGSSEVGRDQI